PPAVKRFGPRGEISARAEGAPRPRDDHHAVRVVAVGGLEASDELLDECAGDRVELLGPVQGDGGDAFRHLVADLLEGHAQDSEGSVALSSASPCLSQRQMVFGSTPSSLAVTVRLPLAKRSVSSITRWVISSMVVPMRMVKTP